MRKERGGTMIEAAIGLPIMLLLIFAMYDLVTIARTRYLITTELTAHARSAETSPELLNDIWRSESDGLLYQDFLLSRQKLVASVGSTLSLQFPKLSFHPVTHVDFLANGEVLSEELNFGFLPPGTSAFVPEQSSVISHSHRCDNICGNVNTGNLCIETCSENKTVDRENETPGFLGDLYPFELFSVYTIDTIILGNITQRVTIPGYIRKPNAVLNPIVNAPEDAPPGDEDQKFQVIITEIERDPLNQQTPPDCNTPRADCPVVQGPMLECLQEVMDFCGSDNTLGSDQNTTDNCVAHVLSRGGVPTPHDTFDINVEDIDALTTPYDNPGSFAIDSNCNVSTLNPVEEETDETTDTITINYITPISLEWNCSGKVESIHSRSKFPLVPGSEGTYLWKGSMDTPLLIILPEENEKLAAENLFGTYTFGKKWKNGFDPLLTLDMDENGRLEGSELEGLGVWFDHGSDGVISDKDKVLTVQDAKIVSINTHAPLVNNASGITRANGFTRIDNVGNEYTGSLVDWYSVKIK